MWTHRIVKLLAMGILTAPASRAYTILPKVILARAAQGASNGMMATRPSMEQSMEQSTRDDTTTSATSVRLEYPVILFDGVCNFCNTWVDLLLRVDVHQRFRFAPLQSTTGQRLLQAVGKDADDISSVVLIQPDLVSYNKSACVLQVVAELGPVARIASGTAQRLVPASWRDSIYDTVATNRYNLMGKRDECRCGDPQYADRFLS